jgi:hypothetical protein
MTDEEKEFATSDYLRLMTKLDTSQVLDEVAWNNSSDGLLMLMGALGAGVPRERILEVCLAIVGWVSSGSDVHLGIQLMTLYLDDRAGLEDIGAIAEGLRRIALSARRAERNSDYHTLRQDLGLRLSYRMLRAVSLVGACTLDGEAALGLLLFFGALADYEGHAGATEFCVLESAARVLRKRIQWEDVHKAMEARRQAAAKFEGVAP